jgi:hypothetical protein
MILKSIFAEKFGETIGVFNVLKIMQNIDHNIGF